MQGEPQISCNFEQHFITILKRINENKINTRDPLGQISNQSYGNKISKCSKLQLDDDECAVVIHNLPIRPIAG